MAKNVRFDPFVRIYSRDGLEIEPTAESCPEAMCRVRSRL